MKKFNLDAKIRPHLRSIVSYSSARNEFNGKAQVFLDANESPFETEFNRYPDPLQVDLKYAISRLRGVPLGKIFIGNGSDEAIDLVIRIFCEPGQNHIITTNPTYGMYKVSASINNVETRIIRLGKNFTLPTTEILEMVTEKTAAIFICSPNNPTGNAFKVEEILKLTDQSGTLVVVDEAYIDFSDCVSMIKFLDRPNLIVLQTLSKAFGLAGLRLGMAFAAEEIISLLNKIKPPYNISSGAQKSALITLNTDKVKHTVTLIRDERENLIKELGKLNCVKFIHHSDANFLLIKFIHAKETHDFLRANGIIVRDRSMESGCEECLRITVGTKDENKLLIELLKDFEKI